jgi:hypothetical protein
LFIEWDIVDGIVSYLQIGKLSNGTKIVLMEDVKNEYVIPDKRINISWHDSNKYRSTCKLTDNEIIELFLRYDILTFDAMIYLNSIINNNFLEDKMINKQLCELLNITLGLVLCIIGMKNTTIDSFNGNIMVIKYLYLKWVNYTMILN